MARHTVTDQSKLPPARGGYVRVSSEPTVVSHPFTGDVYAREDGAPWEHHGYRSDESGVRPATDGVCTTPDPAAEECDAYWNARRKAECERAA